jgi:hypothetical protein
MATTQITGKVFSQSQVESIVRDALASVAKQISNAPAKGKKAAKVARTQEQNDFLSWAARRHTAAGKKESANNKALAAEIRACTSLADMKATAIAGGKPKWAAKDGYCAKLWKARG